MTPRKTALFPALFLMATIPVQAAAPVFDTPAPVAFMKDLSSGAILYAKNPDQRMPPASMAKMMTVYVAFDLIKKGELKLDTMATVRPETWKQWHGPAAGSTMFLSPGEQVSVANLLFGIVTLSGNDACVVLAEQISGTEQAFTVLMNREWKHGMTAAVDVTLLSRYYERFADHAVEVARRIIFAATGHLPVEDPVMPRKPALPVERLSSAPG